jgi:hypothetical protein
MNLERLDKISKKILDGMYTFMWILIFAFPAFGAIICGVCLQGHIIESNIKCKSLAALAGFVVFCVHCALWGGFVLFMLVR